MTNKKAVISAESPLRIVMSGIPAIDPFTIFGDAAYSCGRIYGSAAAATLVLNQNTQKTSSAFATTVSAVVNTDSADSATANTSTTVSALTGLARRGLT